MKRLQYVNLVGVALLVMLCISQWCQEGNLRLQLSRSEVERASLASQRKEQEEKVQSLQSALARFQERWNAADSNQRATRMKWEGLLQEVEVLRMERGQWKTNQVRWMDAMKARDQRIEETQQALQKLADELKASREQFNALAAQHNQTVHELNAIRSKNVPR